MRSPSPFVWLKNFLVVCAVTVFNGGAVAQPLAQVFVWPFPVTTDTVSCTNWNEPQIGPTLERATVLTLGACPDTMSVHGVTWYFKRADTDPLQIPSWCALGADSTGPFSTDTLNLWSNNDNIFCPIPQVGVEYDIAVLTRDTTGNDLTWLEFLNFAPPGTPAQKWAWLINAGYVKRFLVVDTAPPVAHDLVIAPDCTPDSSVIFIHGDVTLQATVDATDVVAVTFAVRAADFTGAWTIIERVEGGPGIFQPTQGFWNTELLNGTFVIGAFAEDSLGNIDGDLSGVGPGPRYTLTANIDNESPVATITAIVDDQGNPVTELERGSVVTIETQASDNFGIHEVRFFYRHNGSEQWTFPAIITDNPDHTWPYSFTLVVPPDFVVGWEYDLLVAAIDLCGLADLGGPDAVLPVVDNEANIAIVTIGGQNALTTPHLHGIDVEVVAHSEPNLDNVRFLFVRPGDTTEIATINGAIGQTEWILDNWDVTALDTGAAEVCAVGSADIGGNDTTIATNCRQIVIDDTVAVTIGFHTPGSDSLVGGRCGPGEPISIGLVMDYSGSMYEADAIDDMEFAAHEFVGHMVPGDRGAVVKFDHQISVVQPFTSDLAAVDSAIFTPYGGGGTHLFDVIVESATLIQSETHRKAIILLTDGADEGSSATAQEAILSAVASGAPFFAIGLGPEPVVPFLEAVATQSGGEFFLAPLPSDLAGIYRQIAQMVFVDTTQFDDIIVEFPTPPSDPDIASVFFEYKLAADPDDPFFWHPIGPAVHDQLTNRWAFGGNAVTVDCGLITLRVVVSDNAVPVPNVEYIIFADSVRVDNCAPTVAITNINGDVTPEGTEIAQGQVARIVVSAMDVFGNGGNSIDSLHPDGMARVDFFYTAGEDTFFIGTDANGAPWETYWNTGGVPFGTHTVFVVATDVAGNCAADGVNIVITDQFYQRAWIVGFDVDNGFGCLDHLWAVTDDCPPNFTSAVRFQYTTDSGTTWISLGEDQTGTPYCDEWLDYNVWGVDFEYDSVIPMDSAIFRAVATDESENDDPNPPLFRFGDVDSSATPAVYNEQWVRVSATQGQVPWVFSTLEDYTQSCPVNGALVCIEPVEGDSLTYAGSVPSETSPCNLNAQDGQLTIFRSVPATQGNTTYMMITAYELNIHRTTQQGGSNGWLTSEDQEMQLYVPANGATGEGVVWFEPMYDLQNVNIIPPQQYYYTLISGVENVMSRDLGTGNIPSHLRLDFDTTLLPDSFANWMVVPAYWNASVGLWSEMGITNIVRDTVNGVVDFQWLVDWNVSDANMDTCPNTARFAVFLTSSAPLGDWVHFSSDNCPTIPDSTYFTPARGVTTDCDPVFWATLRQGEFVPPLNTIDVFLDGIRIVNNGVSIADSGAAVFNVSYNQVSGVFAVWFSNAADTLAPWFGCLGAGPHYVQFFTDNQSSFATPFFVDVTGPQVSAMPGFIENPVTISADLTDPEAGIDTMHVVATLRDCANASGEPTYPVGAEAIDFVVIAGGYRATFTVQWDQIAFLFPNQPNAPRVLCVDWSVSNLVCLADTQTGSYAYTIDMEGPVVIPVAPVGAGIDNDGDGLINEDPRDCLNNDNDFWWADSTWRDRIDEDPIDFAEDTVNCLTRPSIQGFVNDNAMCGSGASGLDPSTFRLNMNGRIYTVADTNNAQLNFHVLWPHNGNDLYFTMGGPGSDAAADSFYLPGEHLITVVIADSAGNFSSAPAGWTYYVRCSGPTIVFSPGACGTWFNPEDSNSQFTFCVEELGGVPIAPNGISYEVWTVPGEERISGPTVIDPAGQDSVCVTYTLSGSFPDGQAGIEVRVVAMNIIANPNIDPDNGITRSNMTFWADNCAPTCTNFTPADGDSLSPEAPIVVQVYFTDDCGTVAGPSRRGGDDRSKSKDVAKVGGNPMMSVSRIDSKGNVSQGLVAPLTSHNVPASDNKRGHGDPLDDNGSGISLACFDLNIVSPSGTNIGPAGPGDYAELDPAHAKFILPIGQASGVYTVNVILCDCVGNYGGCTWQFQVTSTAPAISFCPTDNDSCVYQNLWNPNGPLRLCATVSETDGINTNLSGIRVDILALHPCPSGWCEDTLLANAAYDISEQPDPSNPAQVFQITGSYNFDPHLASPQVRIVVTAQNVGGQTASRSQSWSSDATPPTIMIVSPPPNAVVSNAQPVVISANFSDTVNDSIASIPRRGESKIESQRGMNGLDEGGRGELEKMAGLATGQRRNGNPLDDLEADSGVDPACVDLRLIPLNGGPVIILTDQAIITQNNITWVGPLNAGGYTSILTICDRVCNTASVNWNFTVIQGDSGGGGGSCFVFADPCVITRPQHRIIFRRACENIDLASLRLRLEVQDGRGEFTVLLENAPVQSAGDSSWYDVVIPNFERYAALRITLTGNFVGGAAIPPVSHLCVILPGGGPGEPGVIVGIPFTWPNPFDPGEVTHFVIPIEGGGADVEIKLYSFSGEFVKTVYEGWYMPPADIIWNGTNEDGEQVANGVYLAHVRLSAGGQTRDDILKVAFRNPK